MNTPTTVQAPAYRPHHRRGQIRSMAAYDRGLWDWSCLDGCFGNSNISPTDVDGLVERHGKKLYIETKQPGALVPAGQMRTLQSLVDVDGATVLLVWGSDKKVEKIRKITPFGDRTFERATMDELRNQVSNWYAWADGETPDEHTAIRAARALWESRGPAFCDAMASEWVRLDTIKKITGARGKLA